MSSLKKKIDWMKVDGLLPAIVQDAVTGRVLMLGYMNEEAFEKTQSSGQISFYSRSRKRLWTKGETSGNTLALAALEIDCDGDTILIQASPAGPTCHLDKTSCFDADAAEPGFGFIGRLEKVLDARLNARPTKSYTAELAAGGLQRMAQKIGEEGVELALAAARDDRADIIAEAADLLYHVLVLLRFKDMNFADVARELERRHHP